MIRRRSRETWTQSFRELAEALAEVMRAEASALAGDWQRWGKNLAWALGLAGVALSLVMSLALLMTYFAVRLFETVLDLGPWQAPLAVAGLVFLIILILLGFAYLNLRRAGNPILVLRGRFEDHRSWWRERVLAADEVRREP